MKERWGFLTPWCHALKRFVSYEPLATDQELSNSGCPRLQVWFPRGIFVTSSDGSRIALSARVPEALKLLAAAAYVAPAASKFLLLKSGLNLGKEGSDIFEMDIPVRFVLRLSSHQQTTENGVTVNSLMVLLYGKKQTISDDYIEALAIIAGMDSRLGQDHPGVAIEVPVQMLVDSTIAKHVEGFWRAEKQIRDQWKGVQ